MFLKGERETILNYDPETKMWYAWTSYPPHITKFLKQGWTLIASDEENGRVICADFKAPKNAVRIFDTSKLKNTEPSRDADDEQNEDEEILADELATIKTEAE